MKLQLIVLCAFVAALQATVISFSGDVNADFRGFPSSLIYFDIPAERDVGLPNSLKTAPAPILDTSGWDVEYIAFNYERASDTLFVGFDFFVIAGDADGDGNPDSTSQKLLVLEGEDVANLESSESVSLALEVSGDSVLDVVIGVPGNSAGQGAEIGAGSCPGSTNAGFDCFGLYSYTFLFGGTPSLLYTGERWNQDGPTDAYASYSKSIQATGNLNAAWSDFEFSVVNFHYVDASLGTDVEATFNFKFIAFAGSINDAGIGEDFVPSQFSFTTVEFDCPAGRDECGVCGGSGDNICNSCSGDMSCLDCENTPFGTKTVDNCNVCGGPGQNICNDCNGDLSCLDCENTPFGTKTVDNCNICGGSGQNICNSCSGDLSCLDCSNIPFGTRVDDECGVCGGSGENMCNSCSGDESCLDCSNIPFGPNQMDQCQQCLPPTSPNWDSCICPPPEDYTCNPLSPTNLGLIYPIREVDRIILHHLVERTQQAVAELKADVWSVEQALYAFTENGIGFCAFHDDTVMFNQCVADFSVLAISFLDTLGQYVQ